MGYNTSYELEYENCDDETREQIAATIAADDNLDYGLNSDGDPCKWYDHEEDMKELSKQFPEVLFTLSGNGEDCPDLWKKYFRNGKIQRAEAEIIYPEFDPTRLE